MRCNAVSKCAFLSRRRTDACVYMCVLREDIYSLHPILSLSLLSLTLPLCLSSLSLSPSLSPYIIHIHIIHTHTHRTSYPSVCVSVCDIKSSFVALDKPKRGHIRSSVGICYPHYRQFKWPRTIPGGDRERAYCSRENMRVCGC